MELWNGLPAIRLILGALLFAATGRWVLRRCKALADEEAFARTNGCQPIKCHLPYRWPLGLDILKVQYDALPSGRLLNFQARYFNKLDATFAIHLLGNTGITTTDPKNIEALNVSRFEDFGLGVRRNGCLAFLGEGIFVHDGVSWEHDRKLLRRQFARVQFRDLETFDQPVEDLVSSFEDSKGVVDLQPAFFRFTLGTTTALLFGESVNYMNEQDQLEFGKSFDHASYVTAVRLRLAELCWLYSPKSFHKSCDVVRKHANHFVQKALRCQEDVGEEEAEKRYPFILDLYSELRDPVQVRDQLINVLLAGRDTTACTLSWAFFHLVRHRPALDKLKKEVFEVTEGRLKVTQHDIRRMPYLKAVLDETLRLYPQIPVNVRFAIRHTLLPKAADQTESLRYFFRKAWIHPINPGKSTTDFICASGVGTTPYHMHRRKEIYGEDATAFRPERWLTGELDNVGTGYMPFHSGPRTCLGKDFALTEASYAIVRMLQTYPGIRLPPDAVPEPVGEEKQSITIVVSSAEGCKVLLE